MRFICLCYYNQAQFDARTPADLEKIGELCAPHDAALRATGRVRLNGSLSLPAAARTIRTEGDGTVATVDGPYAATPDPLGAMFLVEAADLDEAVGIARLHPGARLGEFFGGGIEVRAFDHVDMLGA